MKDKLTIVIPAKYEEKYIARTLQSLNKQKGIEGVDVIIADGGSTDNTLGIVYNLRESLKYDISVIVGGTAARGRNAGADFIKKEYILFLDADTTIDDPLTIKKALSKATRYKLITCKIRSRDKGFSKIAFKVFEFFHSKMKEPFSTGVFFLTSREEFERLGGFDETLKHTEDYILSRKYDKNSFLILDAYVTQDSRRFKKMGYPRFIWMLLLNYIRRNDINHFRKDIGYW